MELPITIVFEPPSYAELRALLRSRWLWAVSAVCLALASAIVVLVVGVSRAEARATLASATLTVTSQPSGAEVLLDERGVGRTPAVIAAAPGAHQIRFLTDGALETEYAVDVGATDTRFEALLWQRQPRVTRLRASLPGAALDAAQLLPDGRVAVSLRLGADHALQAWLFDPLTSDYQLAAADLGGTRLAVSNDARWVAVAGSDIGPRLTAGQAPDDVLWLTPTGDQRAAAHAVWRAPVDDILTDVSWAPDQQHLLAVTLQRQQQPYGAARGRVWLIDSDSGAARMLLNLPSRIVPGSTSWSPDGRHIALLAHAGALTALCLLSTDGEFRYLADLEPGEREPLSLPPLSWSSDGEQLLFVAPRQEPVARPDTWLPGSPSRVMYSVRLGSGTPMFIADTDARGAMWREDGQIVALTRARDGGNLELAIATPGRSTQRLLELPLRPGDSYAAAWNSQRASLLIASGAPDGMTYWLVRLGVESQP